MIFMVLIGVVRIIFVSLQSEIRDNTFNRADDKTNNILLAFVALAFVDSQVGVGNVGGTSHVLCGLFLFMCHVGGFPYYYGDARV